MSQVDVVIPSYNYALFLRTCVESVLSQAGVDARVLIIDDTSSDNTPEICKELAAQDLRVEFRRHSQNLGHVRTYNEGIEWARGDYMLLLSADDVLIEGSLKRAADFMDCHPEVSLTYGKEIRFQSGEPMPEVPLNTSPENWEVITSQQFLERACELVSNFVPTPTAIVRTEMQKKLGGYRTEIPHACDMEMWLRFGAHASVGVVNDYQAYYRKHADNMSLNYPGVMDHQQLKAAFDRLFTEYGRMIDDSTRLWTLAYQNLAQKILWDAYSAAECGSWVECRKLQTLAGELWPTLHNEKVWSRLIWKQRLHLIWPTLRSIINYFQYGRKCNANVLNAGC